MHFYLSFGDITVTTRWSCPVGWLVLLRLYLPASAQHFHRRRSAASQCPRFRPGNPQNLLKKFKFVLRAYTESQALASCKFLTLEEDQYLAGYVRLPNPYLGYFLAKLWERDFKDEGSVITESIVNHNGACSCPRKVALQEQLNAFEAYGIIEQRRLCLPFRWFRAGMNRALSVTLTSSCCRPDDRAHLLWDTNEPNSYIAFTSQLSKLVQLVPCLHHHLDREPSR